MARLLVLSFKDNEAAEAAAKLLADGRTTILNEFEHEAVVEGIYAAPTVFCDPGDGHRGKKTMSGWTRGKKYGWWVCGVCKKPSVMWGGRFECVVAQGRNLLADLLAPDPED